jgi:hypothetical protein
MTLQIHLHNFSNYKKFPRQRLGYFGWIDSLEIKVKNLRDVTLPLTPLVFCSNKG